MTPTTGTWEAEKRFRSLISEVIYCTFMVLALSQTLAGGFNFLNLLLEFKGVYILVEPWISFK